MTEKLVGVHPELADRVNRILTAMRALGFPMMVTDGLRTTEQQQKLYAQGRTLPGQIVTHNDGVTTRSNHQAHADGFGHAVDCAFVESRGGLAVVPSWAEHWPWALYGAMAKALGLRWGGEFHTLLDRPHIELP